MVHIFAHFLTSFPFHALDLRMLLARYQLEIELDYSDKKSRKRNQGWIVVTSRPADGFEAAAAAAATAAAAAAGDGAVGCGGAAA